MNAMKIRIVAVLAFMLCAPFVCVSADADAAGSWYDKTTDIYIEAGASFQYGEIKSPDGKEIQSITVQGSIEPYFTVSGNSVSAKFPMNMAEGEYDCVFLVKTSNNTYWMRFLFHVTEPDIVDSGYAANIPLINSIDIDCVGNNTKVASIKLMTSNVDTLKVDFNDGIMTDDITVTNESLIMTHKYSQVGLFAMKFTATNSYGSTQCVVVYDAGQGKAVEYSYSADVDNGYSHSIWVLYGLLGGAVVLCGAYLFTRVPILIFGALICAAASVVDYFWIL